MIPSLFLPLFLSGIFANGTAAQQSPAKKSTQNAPSGKPEKNVSAAQQSSSKNKSVAVTKKATKSQPSGKSAKSTPASKPTKDSPVHQSDEELKAKLDAVAALPLAERIEPLQTFIKRSGQSSLKTRAIELLVSTRAALGDEKLKAGDATGGVDQFRLGVAEAPDSMSDKLFVEVISQLPANLFLRGQSASAFEVARLIEEKVKNNPQRLLSIAAFYLSVEQAGEAARVAELALKLAPDMPAAHQALGAAHRIAFRLDEAAMEFARALELDPKSASARRSLADLRRATGRADDALALYREQLAADPKDKAARAGLVLALLDVGKKEEAARELQAALQDDPRNLSLLVGASYWYVAHGEGGRALELAQQAVAIEPRYTWAQIALARALIMQKRPLDAERALRLALQYGRFPTLDYELANALAANGLYEEAAIELARSFILRGDQIETQLAGRTPARAASFIELLAPERRAGLFQIVAADSENNARMLKGLLAFHLSIGTPDGQKTIDESGAVAAAKDFVADSDEMRTFRLLYVANRLLRRGAALQTVVDFTEAAKGGVEAALNAPAATVAALADELHGIRARAIATGTTPNLPAVQRNILSKVLRGRIEDIAGWALLNQGRTADAVVRLRRAVSVLPENTKWWGDALWHLGAALDASGNQKEALATYIKSYDRESPDPVRRAVIEALYLRVNGSLDGLDAKIGPPSVVTSSASSTIADATLSKSVAPAASSERAEVRNTDTNVPPTATLESNSNPAPAPAKVEAPPAPSPASEAASSPKPETESKPTAPPASPEATPITEAEAKQPAPAKIEDKPAPLSTSEVTSSPTPEASSKPTAPPASTEPAARQRLEHAAPISESNASDTTNASDSKNTATNVSPGEAAANGEPLHGIKTNYDKDADLSSVSLGMLRLHEASDVLDFSASHMSKGPQLRTKEGNSVLNFQYTYTGSFNAIPVPSLVLIIDGKREPMGELEVTDRKSVSGKTQASFRLRIPFFTLQRMARANRIAGRLGTIEFELTAQHLEALRALVSNIPQ